MELNTLNLPDFTALASVIFEKRKDSLPQAMYNSGMVKVEMIPENSGDTRKYTEVDLENYASIKHQSDQASRATIVQGYTKTMSVSRFAKDIGISYEMRHYNKYQEVVARLTNLADLAVNRRELNLQHRYTFGTATSYTNLDGETITITCGDDLCLFSTVHKLNGSSTTYRSRLANNPQLSRGSLEAMEQMKIENTYNHLGEKVTMTFDILWTTDDPNSVNTAREYLKSTASPDGLNNGVINVYQSKYKHVVLPLVATTATGAIDTDKRKYWGIASSTNSDFHLGVWEQPHLKTPADMNAGEEFSTDDWNYGVREGHGICILSGAWVGFSSGDGNA